MSSINKYANKILMVANTDWYLHHFRLSFAQYLQKKGIEVCFVCPKGRFINELIKYDFRWVEWQVERSTIAPWKEIAALIRLVSIYRSEEPDLVHHFTVKPVLYGSLAAKMTGVKMVINSITGLGYIFEGKGLKASVAKPIAKNFYRLALNLTRSENIFENEFDRAFFLDNHFCNEEHTHLIESVGIEANHFEPVPEPAGTPIVVLPARMLWDKGVGVLVDAARILKSRVKVRVVLVGKPDPGNPSNIPEETIQQWVKAGIVEWWGWQRNMKAVYAKSHIVTLPSMHEGSPTGLLEAAASGRPLVATDIPGCRPFVHDEENGLLVPVNDPQTLAEALERLVINPYLRKKMGAAGRKLVLDHYTDEKINQATYEIYANLMRKSSI